MSVQEWPVFILACTAGEINEIVRAWMSQEDPAAVVGYWVCQVGVPFVEGCQNGKWTGLISRGHALNQRVRVRAPYPPSLSQAGSRPAEVA